MGQLNIQLFEAVSLGDSKKWYPLQARKHGENVKPQICFSLLLILLILLNLDHRRGIFKNYGYSRTWWSFSISGRSEENGYGGTHTSSRRCTTTTTSNRRIRSTTALSIPTTTGRTTATALSLPTTATALSLPTTTRWRVGRTTYHSMGTSTPR